MTTSIDRLVSTDLAALGDASRRDMPPREVALRDAGIYRDGRAGAEARRDALANERRLQLALMPLSVAQVFAHRVGRAGAGLMAIACSAVMILLLADPLLLRIATMFLPGIPLNLGLCVLIASTLILATYVVSTWAAEAWFSWRMRDSVTTHGDAYGDLDHLARGPIEVAQQLARKADAWAVGLLLAGVASLATVVGFLIVVVGAFRSTNVLMSTTEVFTMRGTTGNLEVVVFGFLLALGGAFVVGRACERERRTGTASGLLARLSHGKALVAGLAGLVVLPYATFRAFAPMYLAGPPPANVRFLLGIGGVLTVLALATWAVLWWRRHERARLGD